MTHLHAANIAVRREYGDKARAAEALAIRLKLPLIDVADVGGATLMLEYRDGRLALCDYRTPRAKPLFVDIGARIRRYRSLPAPKRGPLARAIGRRTRSIVDATAGWGQDLGMFVAMGYAVTAVERSPVIAALLADGLARLAVDTELRGPIELPRLVVADAVHFFAGLGQPPDCIYMDPMFPPKRKQSTLAKRRLRVLRQLVGDGADCRQLLASALGTARNRVVVKRPDDAPPVAGQPRETYTGKLVRYDVYQPGRRC